uniref:Uncharacterized protein n=1 Tax=Arundo donax TaxID=35708 RepID=A0A0A9I1C8_ARUDO
MPRRRHTPCRRRG